MDKWFTEQYEGILDSVDNIEHKALLKALLVSDESVSQIAARLGVPRHRIYSAAYQHFGKDFIKSRSQRISTVLMMGRVAQGAGQGAPGPAPQPGDATDAPDAQDVPSAPGDPGEHAAPASGGGHGVALLPPPAAGDGDQVEVVAGRATVPAARGPRDSFGVVVAELGRLCRERGKITSTGLGERAGITQRCAARHIERAIALATHGMLDESGCPGLNAYVADIRNHPTPACPELFDLSAPPPAAAGPGGGARRAAARVVATCSATLTVGGLTMAWDQGDPAAAAAAVAALSALGGRGHGAA